MAKAYKLINKALIFQKKSGLKISLRTLAAKLDLSVGYLSKLLSGKKELNMKIADKICKELKIDELQKSQIINQIMSDLIEKKSKDNSKIEIKLNKSLKSFDEMVLMGSEAEWLLSQWYRLPMLDLITCSNFTLNTQAISFRLGISEADVVDCLKALKFYKFISEDKNGNLIKTHNKLRFPTKFSKEIIRNYHEMQMKKAIKSMFENTKTSDFNSRLVTSLTVATNLKNLEKAKSLLHHALYEAAEILSEGECTEVYQLNLQLFSHTKT